MKRVLVLVAVAGASASFADAKHPNPFLSQAKAFFAQGDGDKCLKRLIQAEQKWKHNDKHDRADIELYGGMCGYLTGEQQAAEVSFGNALKLDPKITLPPDAGAGIENLWAKVTGKPAPVASSGTAAATPTPTKADKKDTKVVAAAEPPPPPSLPPQNDARQTTLTPSDSATSVDAAYAPKKKGRNIVLPVLLGVAAVGSGVVGIVLGLEAQSHAALYRDPNTFQSDADKLGSQAKTEALVTDILFAVAGALAIGTLITLIFGGS